MWVASDFTLSFLFLQAVGCNLCCHCRTINSSWLLQVFTFVLHHMMSKTLLMESLWNILPSASQYCMFAGFSKFEHCLIMSMEKIKQKLRGEKAIGQLKRITGIPIHSLNKHKLCSMVKHALYLSRATVFCLRYTSFSQRIVSIFAKTFTEIKKYSVIMPLKIQPGL